MKKTIVLLACIIVNSFAAPAQKANNQIGIGAEIAMPSGQFDNDFNSGFGGYLKGLFGIGKMSQLTFTTGYNYHKAKGELSWYHASSFIIPFLAGYRLSAKGFFVEPQVGYGLYYAQIKDYNMSETDGAFTYAIGAGYKFHGLEAGIKYRGGKSGSDDVSVVAIHLGYNFSFGRK